MDIAKALAEFVDQVEFDQLPEDVKEKSKTCFMNSIGIGISGYELGPAGHAKHVAKEFDSKESGRRATLFMDGAKLSMPGAVAANTVLFHSRAQEDTLGGTHNGTMIVPVVLAVAENFPCTGKEILAATLAGYEVTAVLERKMAKLSTPKGFRPSAIYVTFGVAAAAAKLLKLSKEQIADAIRITASLVGGIQESFAAGTTEWFYQNGCAARNGLTAALLARDGVTGAESAFDGYKGFMNVFAGENDYELVREGIENLGKEYRIRNVTFKFNPCCAIAQTPFIVSCELADEKKIDHEQIESIHYHMNPFDSNYPGTKGKGPFVSDTQTTMSCAFNIANAIVNRTCTKKGQQVFDDERILNLVDRTTVVDDDHYPILCGKVVIKMKDGTVYEKEMMITEEYYQLSWEENAKLMIKVHDEVGLDPNKTKKLLDLVYTIETAENADALIEEMSRP
ncbi:MmgE/PrpD family protein [Ihubacter massiliensis]|uniref:MmgE/PrpD family protein n=1 Tax=Hominibacterium faecale TaxID=2839743 RepID=A0A9J6QN82_9FIRM|nr:MULTISPECIES: MmgE/PrpD family protein [Eubacteriales Family XIII. Incertae Sedis]MCO7121644.1 MmgE/PrpD family protein [Ihubacter massiliensis]MCU7378625.1 MmgE/PrpD family protein [Hominibacterium faecale]